MKSIFRNKYKFAVLLFLSFLVSSFYITDEQEYFEGIITYKKSYEIIHPNATMDYLENNYGTKQILIYKNGNSKRINLNKNGDTINILVYNINDKRVYGTFDVTSDTLLTYSMLNNDFNSYKIMKAENEKLKKLELLGFKIDYYLKNKFAINKIDTISSINYYSKKYKLNPKFHEYIKDGFNNEIIKNILI